MFGIIFGVIALSVLLLVWKNTYRKREYVDYYNSNEFKYFHRLKLPLWLLLIFIVVFLTPILNVVATISAIVTFSIKSNDGWYIHFNIKKNSILSRIILFFNKDIFKDK